MPSRPDAVDEFIVLAESPSPPGTAVHGPSGAVTRATTTGQQARAPDALLSLAGPTGAEATGPNDRDFASATVFITVVSAGGTARPRPSSRRASILGMLLAIDPNGVEGCR